MARHFAFQGGTTDKSVYFRALIGGNGASAGDPETSLVFNTSGLTAKYIRDLGSATPITLATQTVTGAHSDGGFVHVADGEYRLDLPDAAIASGVDRVRVVLAKTGVVFEPIEIALFPDDPFGAALTAADVNAEVDQALADIHLDHLLAVDYDPAAKPGVATALLNELVENDAGVSRFTANALEQAPSGGGGTADWTATEREQIRHRLGIDGTATAPTTGVPSLATAAAVSGVDTKLGAPAGASLAADVAAVKSDTAAILDDTGTSGVKVNDTTPVRSNVKRVNDVDIQGAGVLGNEWRPV